MSRAAAAGIAAYPTGIEHGTVTLRARRAHRRGHDAARRHRDRRPQGGGALRHRLAPRCRTPRFHDERALRRCRRHAVRSDRRASTTRSSAASASSAIPTCASPRIACASTASSASRRATAASISMPPASMPAAARRDRLGRLSAERVGAEMKRMLALPKVALTLQAMSLAGILAIGPETQRLLTSYELRADPPTLAARLALFVAAIGAKPVQSQWRLSNGEMSRATDDARRRRSPARRQHPRGGLPLSVGLADAQSLAAVIDHWPPERAGEVRGVLAGLDGAEISRSPAATSRASAWRRARRWATSSRASRPPGSRAASPSTSRRCSHASRALVPRAPWRRSARSLIRSTISGRTSVSPWIERRCSTARRTTSALSAASVCHWQPGTSVPQSKCFI